MQIYSYIISALLLAAFLFWFRRFLLNQSLHPTESKYAWIMILIASFAFVGFKMILDYEFNSNKSNTKLSYLNPEAQLDIGRAYYLGKDLPKDDNQALFWLMMSAQNGNNEARELLSLFGYSVQGTTNTEVPNKEGDTGTNQTNITFAVDIIPAGKVKTTLKDVAGLSEIKSQIDGFIEAISHAKNYTKLGAQPPRGIILYGPPGTGKTMIARAIAGEAKATFISTTGAAFEENYVGVGASRVRELFNIARQNKPAIIFIDEIDAVAPSRKGESLNQSHIQTINQLLAEMDNMKENNNSDIYIIAATNRLESLDSAILRPGRFDWQIQVPLPNDKDRLEILNLYLKKIKTSKEINVDELVIKSAGFSGADLRNLVNEAAFIAGSQKKNEVDTASFEAAFKKISGYEKALSPELSVKILPSSQIKTNLSDIAGMNEVKNEVAEVVQYLADPEKFTRLGAKPPGGILIYGPPGTGKTMMARAIAGEAKVNFLSISGSAFDERYVGVGAARVRELFSLARRYKPCIVFIDEIDALAPKREANDISGRDQTINQFLNELDNVQKGINEGIIFIAATNRIDVIDEAVLRPGRFDRKVYFRLPNQMERESIIELSLKKIKVSKDVNLKLLAQTTVGFSGADLVNMVNEATIDATRRNKDEVDMASFEEAIDKITLGVKQDVVYSNKERKLTAYHEAGHAIVGLLNPNYPKKFYKITIGFRGMSLGVTHFRQETEEYSMSKSQYEALIATAFGGYVAEEMIFGKENVTSGAASDLEYANKIAKEMVTKWGMSDDQSFIVNSVLNESDEVINRNAEIILKRNYQVAKAILEKNKDKLDLLANALLEKEMMDYKQIKELLKLKDME